MGESRHDAADRRPTVLVVEDAASVRRAMVAALGTLDAQVVAVGTAVEAAAAAAVAPVDVLLTEMVLPDSTGTALAESLRRRHPLLRVVFVGWFDHRLSPEPGDAPSLKKPFGVAELRTVVGDALGRDRR